MWQVDGNSTTKVVDTVAQTSEDKVVSFQCQLIASLGGKSLCQLFQGTHSLLTAMCQVYGINYNRLLPSTECKCCGLARVVHML